MSIETDKINQCNQLANSKPSSCLPVINNVRSGAKIKKRVNGSKSQKKMSSSNFVKKISKAMQSSNQLRTKKNKVKKPQPINQSFQFAKLNATESRRVKPSLNTSLRDSPFKKQQGSNTVFFGIRELYKGRGSKNELDSDLKEKNILLSNKNLLGVIEKQQVLHKSLVELPKTFTFKEKLNIPVGNTFRMKRRIEY